MKRVAQRCEQCGGPMQIVAHGGQEPDPDRRGKYRPSTTAQIGCATAMEEQRRAIAEARRLVMDALPGSRPVHPHPLAARPRTLTAAHAHRRRPMTTMTTRTFRAPAVCHIIGVTYRQLDYWDRAGWLQPSAAPRDGTGHAGQWTSQDLLRLAVTKHLIDHGLAAQKAATAARTLELPWPAALIIGEEPVVTICHVWPIEQQLQKRIQQHEQNP